MAQQASVVNFGETTQDTILFLILDDKIDDKMLILYLILSDQNTDGRQTDRQGQTYG